MTCSCCVIIGRCSQCGQSFTLGHDCNPKPLSPETVAAIEELARAAFAKIRKDQS